MKLGFFTMPIQFVAAGDWVAVLPFIMMLADLDGGHFEIRPLDDPPFYSEFVLIEPARKVLSPAAALFARLLEAEARQAELIFRKRVAGKTVDGRGKGRG